MCRCSVGLVLAIIATAKTDLENLEGIPSYTFTFSNPSSLHFQDIYTNLVPDDKTGVDDEPASTTTEISYVLTKDKAQYVEFHPEMTTEPPSSPPPKYILNSTFLRRTIRTKKTTTTEDPEDLIRVVPMKNVQRGVLDLLFPESRVKAFKSIFDTIKRMLSHTFRR